MSLQMFFMGRDGNNVKCMSSKTGKVVDSFFGDCDSVDPKPLPKQYLCPRCHKAHGPLTLGRITSEYCSDCVATFEVAGHQESDFVFEIEKYLNRHKDQAITMKRIQSRFKHQKVTCLEYSNLLSKRGYWIDTKGPTSQWAVTVRTHSYE